MHVLFVADDSDSVRGETGREIQVAVESVVSRFQAAAGGRPYFRLSCVLIGSTAAVLAEGVDLYDVDISRLNLEGRSGRRHLGSALRETTGCIVRHAEAHHCPPYVFLLLGGPPDDLDLAAEEAERLKKLRLPWGQPRLRVLLWGEWESASVARLASTPAFFTLVQTSDNPSTIRNRMIWRLPSIGGEEMRVATVGERTTDSLESGSMDLDWRTRLVEL